MKRIKDFLDVNKVEYTVSKEFGSEKITVILERGKFFIDTRGKMVYWNRELVISKCGNYYILTERIGYNRNKTHIETRKQKKLIAEISNVINSYIRRVV